MPLRLITLLAFFLSWGSAGMTSPSAALPDRNGSRPNFVMVVIDDAALMDLGIYGGEASTPNIDALAGAGAMFTR